MFGKLFNKEKPNYGLLEQFINKPGKKGENFRGALERMYDDEIISQGPAGPFYNARGIYQIPTDEGNRYYFGSDNLYDRGALRHTVRDDAIARYQTYPADSLTTKQLKQFQRHGMFDK